MVSPLINSQIIEYLIAKHLAQIIITGVQVVGRAFAKALRQEIAGSYLETNGFQIFNKLKRVFVQRRVALEPVTGGLPGGQFPVL
ncbi:hypothetical protein Avbf_02157 [Armadillidium vulgare]|nr:hypothetical protein Avbf_02157 [Armadillidium vulgare]